MKTFIRETPNTVYYVTSVTFNRVKIFANEGNCTILIATLAEVRRIFPYKLIAYVIMPDHFHAVINPIDGDISKWLLRVRGNSARRIIDELKVTSSRGLLDHLSLDSPQKRNHRFALWQKDPSIVDLRSEKFMFQKAIYIHMNPVRAGLADHPAKWRWSSYRAYLPHKENSVPLEMDRTPYWTEDEISHYKKGVNL